jgi:NADH-quinone oxidoreductase subunit H
MNEGLVLSLDITRVTPWAAHRLRIALFAWLGVTALLLVMGCERQIAPPLIEVTELTPREIEPGDRLEVHGTGFPQGRSGRVTLEGTLFRPGETPSRVSFDGEGTVATPERLEMVVRDGLADRFCGRGDRAVHATFRGDAEVAFASNNPGAPPLVGVSRGVVLDVMPSAARASLLSARMVEGARVLEFLGVVPGAPSPRGIPVEQVRAKSLAAESGIQVGDVLASVDGVNVLSLGDIAPASARSVDFTVRHADSGTEETKTLSLIEYSGDRVPVEYAPALLVVGLALAMLLLFMLPGPASLAALELRLASTMRRTTPRALLKTLVGSGKAAALSAIVSAIIAAFALMPYVVGREVDGVVLLASATIFLVWSRLAGERGVLASLRTSFRTLLSMVAVAVATALAIGQVGAIELAEIVRLQSGAPWQFTAARHPSCAVLAIVSIASIIGILRTSIVAPGEKLPAHAPLLERAGLLLAAALFVTMFFGGWQLPGVNDARGRGLALLASLVFVMKTWLLAGSMLAMSRVTTSQTFRDLQSTFLFRLLPGLLVGAALVAVSRRLVPSIALETAFGGTVVALALLFSVRTFTRVRSALSRPEPHASPFL